MKIEIEIGEIEVSKEIEYRNFNSFRKDGHTNPFIYCPPQKVKDVLLFYN